jgi:Uma2 family endonuclease
MATEAKIISFDEWRAMPETNRPYEILDGRLIHHPSPSVLHQMVVSNLAAPLSEFARRSTRGIALLSPIDLVIHRQPLRTRQPDILFISFKRIGKTLRELRSLAFLEMPLEVAVEVLSSNCGRTTAMKKALDYISNGTRECWFVSPEAETVEVLELSSEGAKKMHLCGTGDTLCSEVLPGFKMKIDEIFA